jgi:hypothetical protein
MGRPLRKHEWKRILANLGNAPALRNEFLYGAVLMAARTAGNTGNPRQGDSYDGNHFVAASNTDFLVSDDEAFRNLIAPASSCYRPKVCSLNDFLANCGLTAEEIRIVEGAKDA